MKLLYTEEEVIRALKLAHANITPLQNIIDKLTPLKLPSDEEIYLMFPLHYTEFGNGLNEGAKQMRDTIQGGNNEQQ